MQVLKSTSPIMECQTIILIVHEYSFGRKMDKYLLSPFKDEFRVAMLFINSLKLKLSVSEKGPGPANQ